MTPSIRSRIVEIVLIIAGSMMASACAKRPISGTLTDGFTLHSVPHSRSPVDSTLDEGESPASPEGAAADRPNPRSSPMPSSLLLSPPTRGPRPNPPAPPVSFPTSAYPWLPKYLPPAGVSPMDVLGVLTRRYAQAVGVYYDGTLEKGDQLAGSGPGFIKIFQERERAFGTLDLLSLVRTGAKEIRRDRPATEVLQIGDISGKRGGRIGNHGSHQNGLDADIAYFRRDHRVMAPKGAKSGATGFDENFVTKNGTITPNFDVDANWRFVQILVDSGRVDRIFTDRKMKKEFCAYAVARGMREEWGETLRKLRHWPHHQDHFHVRLTCPRNSLACKPTKPIPDGDGCDPLLSPTPGARTGFAGGLESDAPDSADDRGC